MNKKIILKIKNKKVKKIEFWNGASKFFIFHTTDKNWVEMNYLRIFLDDAWVVIDGEVY